PPTSIASPCTTPFRSSLGRRSACLSVTLPSGGGIWPSGSSKSCRRNRATLKARVLDGLALSRFSRGIPTLSVLPIGFQRAAGGLGTNAAPLPTSAARRQRFLYAQTSGTCTDDLYSRAWPVLPSGAGAGTPTPSLSRTTSLTFSWCSRGRPWG